ncbi:MAG: RDD family protein [Proteobacteria bacterium]|nr:RDD family protein [Pseudomonadota bacterium]
MTENNALEPSSPAYAGFWRRVLAYLVDMALIGIPWTAITWFVAPEAFRPGPDGEPVTMTMIAVVVQVAGVVVWILYKGLLEGGGSGATVGKRIVGLRVRTATGEVLGFWCAIYRAWPYWMPSLVMLASAYRGPIFLAVCVVVLISYLFVAFTPRKQGLHDMMAKCLVVRAS